MKNLEEFVFGRVDGKNEAKEELFLEYFFDHQDMYNKLENGKYLILGNKGTGKTFLLEYFRKKKEEEGNIFSDIYLESFFSKKDILQINKGVVDNTKLLKWIIYIELAKVILSLDGIDMGNKEVKRLKRFMVKNQFELKLDTNKIVESSLEKGIKGSLNVEKGFFGGFFEKIKKINVKEKNGEYYEYIEDLENVIIKILQEEWKSENFIYIIFDELDNINDFSKETYSILLNLIKVSNDLNNKWEKRVKIKILMGMRLDIYLKLNATYTNKIKEDSGIVLGWGKYENWDSPLFKMIYHKMRVSDNSLNGLEDEAIRRKLFPFLKIRIHGKKIPIAKYILGKTLLRPRDIICFFNRAKAVCRDKNSISAEDLQKIGNEFSEYIYTELRNQSHGIMEVELFDDGIRLLKNFRKTVFSYEEIKENLEENESLFKHVTKFNLKEVISNFYEIGLLGIIKTTNGHGQITCFKYKDDMEMSLKDEFAIHYGIRGHLKLNIENNLSDN